jgi:hypothetical protein
MNHKEMLLFNDIFLFKLHKAHENIPNVTNAVTELNLFQEIPSCFHSNQELK